MSDELRLLYYRSKQMSKPSYKALPWCAELEPPLLRKFEAAVLVALKHLGQLGCGARVYDDGVLLVVEAKTARIEVGTTYCAKASVHHYYFSMVKSRLININVGTTLHQFVHIIEHTIGR